MFELLLDNILINLFKDEYFVFQLKLRIPTFLKFLFHLLIILD